VIAHPPFIERADEAVNAAHLVADNTFLSLGYTQEEINNWPNSVLALQLPFMQVSESMGNHDSKIVDAASVD